MKLKIKKTLISSAQLLIIAAIRLVYAGRVKVYINAKESKVKGPVVIAANHISGLDPFILGCFVPLKIFFKLYPYSFMTANVFYYTPLKPLCWLAGCYPAKPQTELTPPNNYGVQYAINSFHNGYSVVMFPEGKRTKKQIEAKPGISRILDATDATLLLCHIQWGSVGPFRTVNLTYKIADKSTDTSNPDAIMNAVYGLQKAGKLISARQTAI